MDTIGDRIRLAIKQKGITQVETAKRVGIHPNMLRRYIKNDVEISVFKLQLLAFHLDCTIEWLITGMTCKELINYRESREMTMAVNDGGPKWIVERNVEIVKSFLKLDEEDKLMVSKIINSLLYVKLEGKE